MWLLNTSTFRLEEYYSNAPSYAILSHRWKEHEELSFGGLQEPHPLSNRIGYKKIKSFCREARKRCLAYAWVDTCCIDKSSSAELSEAINSMYTYYKRAAVCYVHLNDVVSRADLAQSSWFTRGWTLQELLAPSELQFFNRKWRPMGSKRSLAPKIEKMTGIPRKALRGFNPAEYCVAEKFSWAAKRETTREEDCAYCLLGLFQINMPLLYGEGARAFQRLQEEIMKISTDMSIFLWQGPACDTFGMLAARPSCFSDVLDTVGTTASVRANLFSIFGGWSMNNAGLSMEANIHPYLLTEDFECIFALHLRELHTVKSSSGFAVFLKKHRSQQRTPSFSRVTVDGCACASQLEMSHGIYLPFGYEITQLRLTRQPLEDVRTSAGPCGYAVNFTSDASVHCAAYQRPADDPLAELRSWEHIQRTWHQSPNFLFTVDRRSATGLHGYLLFTLMDGIEILVCLGLNWNFQPLCIVLPLCKQMRDEGLCSYTILREYRDISAYERESHKIFDTGIQMIGLCGEDHCLESKIDLGLFVEISDLSSHTGKFEAKIEFDTGKFIQYYLHTADLSCYGSLECIPREIYERLLDIESELCLMRRKRYLY